MKTCVGCGRPVEKARECYARAMRKAVRPTIREGDFVKTRRSIEPGLNRCLNLGYVEAISGQVVWVSDMATGRWGTWHVQHLEIVDVVTVLGTLEEEL